MRQANGPDNSESTKKLMEDQSGLPGSGYTKSEIIERAKFRMKQAQLLFLVATTMKD
ncbi:MAG: hypothetical protein HQL69_21905 [Magnetococcales bacterium]|nr:hypothetical protein [Magnetococcales bacterium]